MRNEKKLRKFRKNQEKIRKCKDPKILNSIVHNFPSYSLTAEEMNGLSYSLDHHITTKADRTTITRENEQFFRNLLKDISHIPDHEVG